MPVVVEVVVASLTSAVLWQAFKRMTSLGQAEVSAGLNFSPGIVIILIALGSFLWNHKKFPDYGVSLLRWPGNLKTGLVLVLMVIPLFLATRFHFVHLQGSLRSPYGSSESPYLIDAALAVGIVAFFPWILRFAQNLSLRFPTALALIILVSLWTIPLALASWRHQPLFHNLLVVLGLILTTGFGEELFYWGYIQPRLNEVLGRPYFFGGIQFGFGLVVTALLFGLIHSLNGVDILHGHFNLNLGWGLVALLAGLVHGLLRERTGSILAGMVFHGINDVWVLVAIPLILA